MKLTLPQRQHLADKLMDTANAIMVAFVISGFVEGRVRVHLVAGGVVVYLILIVATTTLRKGDDYG